jgi:CheY-like chemotaxis protein
MQTVLIADNDAAVRRLLRWTITAGDRVVLEAADGDATWDLMHQARPDIVLLDSGLQGRGGYALARAIKTDVGLAASYVVMLSARNRPADAAAGLAAGADRYVTKPFSPLALLSLLEQARPPQASSG